MEGLKCGSTSEIPPANGGCLMDLGQLVGQFQLKSMRAKVEHQQVPSNQLTDTYQYLSSSFRQPTSKGSIWVFRIYECGLVF